MKKSRVKQLCAVALAATLGLSVLAGCGSKTSDNKSAAKGTDKQEIMFNLGSDPKTLDPGLNQSVDGSIVIVNAFEGLYKLDDKNKPVPGQAEKCDVSADGLTYTFHLKKDLKWSNGDPLKASDFEYAWKRVINPETASQYSFQMLYIKGAQEYNTGKGTADQVGVKATDDSTLVVNLVAPCSYFLDLTATATYMPINQKVVEANKDWATDAKTLVSNGPFKFTDYKIKDQIVLEKNDNYEAKDDVKLSKVTMKLVTEPTSAWASYKSGQFDMVYDVPTSEKAAAIADKTATVFPELGNAYIDFNVSDKQIEPEAAKALKNPKFRQALNIAIDRQSIIDNVLKAKQVAAHGFVPEGINGPDGKDFASKKYFEPNANIEEAKKLLAEAGYPDGKGLPQITLLFNPEGGNADVMQPIQDMWKKIGVNVELQTQEWKVFQDTRSAKNYQIARDAWGADYPDPMTFLDMFATSSPQNNAGYSNPKYDALIDSAKKEADATKRFEMLHQAEDMLMADMPIISLWYSNRTHGVKDYVKGIRKDMLGNIYFTKAYIEGKK